MFECLLNALCTMSERKLLAAYKFIQNNRINKECSSVVKGGWTVALRRKFALKVINAWIPCTFDNFTKKCLNAPDIRPTHYQAFIPKG